MSHYTLQSGKRTDTITSRCPICNAVTHRNANDVELTDITVCCPYPTKDCAGIYIAKLLELWDRAQVWGTQRGMMRQNESDIFDAYMIEIGV